VEQLRPNSRAFPNSPPGLYKKSSRIRFAETSTVTPPALSPQLVESVRPDDQDDSATRAEIDGLRGDVERLHAGLFKLLHPGRFGGLVDPVAAEREMSEFVGASKRLHAVMCRLAGNVGVPYVVPADPEDFRARLDKLLETLAERKRQLSASQHNRGRLDALATELAELRPDGFKSNAKQRRAAELLEAARRELVEALESAEPPLLRVDGGSSGEGLEALVRGTDADSLIERLAPDYPRLAEFVGEYIELPSRFRRNDASPPESGLGPTETVPMVPNESAKPPAASEAAPPVEAFSATPSNAPVRPVPTELSPALSVSPFGSAVPEPAPPAAPTAEPPPVLAGIETFAAEDDGDIPQATGASDPTRAAEAGKRLAEIRAAACRGEYLRAALLAAALEVEAPGSDAVVNGGPGAKVLTYLCRVAVQPAASHPIPPWALEPALAHSVPEESRRIAVLGVLIQARSGEHTSALLVQNQWRNSEQLLAAFNATPDARNCVRAAWELCRTADGWGRLAPGGPDPAARWREVRQRLSSEFDEAWNVNGTKAAYARRVRHYVARRPEVRDLCRTLRAADPARPATFAGLDGTIHTGTEYFKRWWGENASLVFRGNHEELTRQSAVDLVTLIEDARRTLRQCAEALSGHGGAIDPIRRSLAAHLAAASAQADGQPWRSAFEVLFRGVQP
jgi:hypothetical protein